MIGAKGLEGARTFRVCSVKGHLEPRGFHSSTALREGLGGRASRRKVYNGKVGRMIRSYRDRDTERLAAGERVRRWEPFRRQAEKRIRILESATSLSDLAVLNSNRLETLKGNRRGQYSIRINDQWRICFQWPKEDAGPSNVEIVDYH